MLLVSVIQIVCISKFDNVIGIVSKTCKVYFLISIFQYKVQVLVKFNFAIGNKEFAEFSILANGSANAIAKIELRAVEIEGTDKDIPVLYEKYDIKLIIIAIPSANNVQRAEILKNIGDVNAEIKMLPRVADFYKSNAKSLISSEMLQWMSFSDATPLKLTTAKSMLL